MFDFAAKPAKKNRKKDEEVETECSSYWNTKKFMFLNLYLMKRNFISSICCCCILFFIFNYSFILDFGKSLFNIIIFIFSFILPS